MTTDQNVPQAESLMVPDTPRFNAQEEAYKRRMGKSDPINLQEQKAASIEAKSPTSDDEIVDTDSQEASTADSASDGQKVVEQDEQKIQEKEDLSAELSKLKKRNEDIRSYASDVKRRLSLTQAKITSLMASGDLEEEAGQAVLEALRSTTFKEPEDLKQSLKEPADKDSQSILMPLYKNLTSDLLDQYLEVSEDDAVSDKINAFDALIAQSSDEEQRTILDGILEKGKTPMSHLKAVLAVGQEFLDEGFGDYLKAGSFKKYTMLWQEKQTLLENKVDNLQKKLLQYEGNFDRPDKMNLGGSITGGGATNRKFNAQDEARRLREARQRLPL